MQAGLVGIRVSYSALIPAARMTLPHFSVSSAMSLPYSAGEPDSGVPPISASRALIVGSARPALTSRLSRSTMSAGVPFGAAMPKHQLASQPGNKACNGRNVGQRFGTFARAHRERPQPVGADKPE